MLLIITSIVDELAEGINVNDFERLLVPNIQSFGDFLRFSSASHILSVNCDEMARDKPKQSAYEIFSIKCRFQQFEYSLNILPQTSRRVRLPVCLGLQCADETC